MDFILFLLKNKGKSELYPILSFPNWYNLILWKLWRLEDDFAVKLDSYKVIDCSLILLEEYLTFLRVYLLDWGLLKRFESGSSETRKYKWKKHQISISFFVSNQCFNGFLQPSWTGMSWIHPNFWSVYKVHFDNRWFRKELKS